MDPLNLPVLTPAIQEPCLIDWRESKSKGCGLLKFRLDHGGGVRVIEPMAPMVRA
jgi:hypothetical protein